MKQRKFAKIYVATGSKAKAYKGAYDVGSQGGKGKRLGVGADMILRSPRVQELVRMELDKVGLREGKLAAKLNDIIDAGTTESKLKFVTPTLSLDAIKEVNKMKGNYAAEKKQIDKRTSKLNIDLKGKSMEELVNVASELKSQIKSFQRLMDNGKIRAEEADVIH